MKRNIPLEISLLLLTGLFPLYGLLHLGWSPFNTSFIYIIETFILLIFFELKIFLKAFGGIYKHLYQGTVFMFPIVIFSVIQLFLSTVMFATESDSISNIEIRSAFSTAISSLSIAILLLFIKNGVDFIYYILNKQYMKVQNKQIEINATRIGFRLFIMQATVIIGGAIGKVSQNASLGVTILIFLQLLLSLRYYFLDNKSESVNS